MFDDISEVKTREEILTDTPADVVAEAEQLLGDEELLSKLLEMIRTSGVTGEQDLVLTLFLVGTSRLLQRPMACIVQGPSSSGKSYVIEKVAQAFPPESVLMATDMTANALYYMPPEKLKHCFVVVGERPRRRNDDSAAATKALREMIASGRLSKSVAESNRLTGQMETRIIEQEGPIAYVESTTELQIFEEDANRCLLVSTDERPEQTGRIVRALARDAAGVKAACDKARVLSVLRTVQRLIEPHPVVIPYAEVLANHFAFDRVEAQTRVSASTGDD